MQPVLAEERPENGTLGDVITASWEMVKSFSAAGWRLPLVVIGAVIAALFMVYITIDVAVESFRANPTSKQLAMSICVGLLITAASLFLCWRRIVSSRK